ncbi:MAG: hypothetical protein KGJ06_03855 [Pseudomonadota bacterium]|nr:hypothetical protein [Pseudomonadota bacterium]
MEALGTFLIAIFIALILGTALAFGFALIVWFMAVALLVAALVLIREWWRRWMFVRSARPPAPHVTDAEYEDIEDER